MERGFFTEIRDFLFKSKVHSILLIRGARQVGKTYAVETVLDQTKRPSIRINLERDLVFRNKIDKSEDFDEFTFLLKSDFGFDPDVEQIVFIDEAQESEKLGAYVRFMKEEWKNKKVILTGSSTTRLFKKKQRVPVGRFASLKVSPFSFEEYLRFLNRDALLEEINQSSKKRLSELIHEQLLKDYDRYLAIGGMPQVLEAVKNGENYESVRTALILSQKEDFISKTKIEDSSLFDDCLFAVANHVGSPSKYTAIGSSYHRAREIMSIMVNWLLILEVWRQGMDPNKGDYLPKRYLYDIGVLRHYQNRPFRNISILDAAQPDLRTHLGGIFENALLITLEGRYFRQGHITTWKRSQTTPHEVDFIIRKDGQYIPIECKASLRVTNRSFVNVIRYLELSRQDRGYVVSAAPYQVFDTKKFKLINLPAYMASSL